jgi:hypothetical protein
LHYWFVAAVCASSVSWPAASYVRVLTMASLL